jgi:predicted nucleotidyltransferase
MTHGLSEHELAVIRSILSRYQTVIDSVRVFGSRAMGNYSDYSDLDLVIDGPIELDQVDRLVTLFDESNLGLSVDVKGYRFIDHVPLKQHIDTTAVVLFTQTDLG